MEDKEEILWIQEMAKNPSFDFLKEPEEDIYTLKDGEPIDDSIIKLHKVVSVPRSFIKRKLGVLNKETQEVVNEKLKMLFEL